MRKMCKSCTPKEEERTEHELLDGYIIIALLRRTKLAAKKRNLGNANSPRGKMKEKNCNAQKS